MATQRLQKTGSLIQLIPSAPDQSHTVFYDVLIAALYQAQHNIVISTPYFVPDDALLLALTTAARRKVSVFLIVPAKVDSFLVRHASLAYFRELLDSGVHIAQFQDGLLHTKSVVIDESVAFFGTVNMDMRSFYLNLELTLALYSVADIRVLAAQQQHYLQDSILVDAQAWKHRSVPSRLLENVVRLLGPLL
ncbi:putative phospholipase D [Vitreoscilla sp. C1]|uniref:phospholipase D-like domain-containing protein n=1 Tax=Vitreoscilla sp. (strain C1) TaxID=96942 RepID=UPI00159A8C79|nr:phospholipase D-like domain-containing protein [Vitreoscilla sp. C1]AUZ04303.2 putative phospholipase D [Vitreoscilla sp. C1]